MSNPLLEPPSLPFDAVPFDRIHADHFVPALAVRITEARTRLAAFRADPARPGFANTFAALERATADVYDVAAIFGNLRSAHGDAALHALAKEIMPKLMALESDINLDPAIFARVQAAHAALDRTAMTPEQVTLAERTYRSFKRNGSLLGDAEKARLRAIDDELSTLGPQFSENVLKATNAFELVVTDAADLAGLPESAVEAAAQTARERRETKQGLGDAAAGPWVFTLQGPSMLGFLRYAERRALRQKLWQAHASRAVHGELSNQALVRRIATLRHDRAVLLGYASHAHFQTEERMAEHPDKVKAFLERLLARSRPAAEREMAELQAFMHAKGCDEPLMPWDYAFWSNKLKEERFRLSSEELRPYFQLEHVLEGAFEHARRLFGLEFKATTAVPCYAPDMQVFEVTDQATGRYMGLLYTDFFPRATKGGGAWCTRFKGQWREGGKDFRPHVSIVCSFTKPTATKPSLLTFQEVNTLFHEFGHALHSLLSRCEFRSLACTSVYRDFVELPSQIMENWIKEKAGLALFARHYVTGAAIPDDLVRKLIASENFHAGYFMLRQLRFGLLDLAWYGGDPRQVDDVLAFELAATRPTDLMPNPPGVNVSCAFEHVFSGGYSAGYYGYKWAEVLDADAFEMFQEQGIFSADVAGRFRRAILERGGSEHPMQLYREFRGREPDPDALLRRSGLL